MMDLAPIATRIRARLDAELPDGWRDADASWLEVGGFEHRGLVRARVRGGGDIAVPMSDEIAGLLAEASAALDDPGGRGRPFQLSLSLEARPDDEAPEPIEGNWQARPVIGPDGVENLAIARPAGGSSPSAAEWAAELRAHPRAPEHVPAWWQAILATGDDSWQPPIVDASGRAAPATVDEAMARPNPLPARSRASWSKPEFQAVLRVVDEAIGRLAATGGQPLLDRLVGRLGGKAQDEAQERLAAQAAESALDEAASLPARDVAYTAFAWSQLARRPLIGPESEVTEASSPLRANAATSAASAAHLALLPEMLGWLAAAVVRGRFGRLPDGAAR